MTTLTRSVSGFLKCALGALGAGVVSLGTIACGQAVPARPVATPLTPPLVSVVCPGRSVHSNQELARFAPCTKVMGDLRIRNVTSLSALSGLRAVHGKLDISSRELRSLSGLEALTKVRRLSLRDNPNLLSLAALSRLRFADSIVIEGAPSLTDSSGLEGVSWLEMLDIEDTGLRRLDGLRSLSTLRHLVVLDNPELVSAAGLSRIENAESIEIQRNRLLYGGADEFLPRLTWATEVVLSDNASMSAAEVLAFRRRVVIAPAPSAGERASR